MPIGLLLGGIPWRLVAAIGIFAGVLLGAVYVTGQIKKIGRLESEVAIATNVARINAQTVKIERAEYERREMIASTWAATKDKIRANHATVRKAIASAPTSDDGPLAPVLRQQLERMRGQAPAGAADRAPAPAGSAGALPGAVP